MSIETLKELRAQFEKAIQNSKMTGYTLELDSHVFGIEDEKDFPKIFIETGESGCIVHSETFSELEQFLILNNRKDLIPKIQ